MRKSHLVLSTIAGGLVLLTHLSTNPHDPYVSNPPTSARLHAPAPLLKPAPTHIAARLKVQTPIAGDRDSLADSAVPVAGPGEQLVGVIDEARGTIRMVAVPQEPTHPPETTTPTTTACIPPNNTTPTPATKPSVLTEPSDSHSIAADTTNTWLEIDVDTDGSIIHSCYKTDANGSRVLVAKVRVTNDTTSTDSPANPRRRL
jgi:hypothetical protein